MIINKSSYERGFAHGVIHKVKVIMAAPMSARDGQMARSYFANPSQSPHLDKLGLPPIGSYLQANTPMYSYVDSNGDPHVEVYHDDEPCYVEQVTLIGGQGISG